MPYMTVDQEATYTGKNMLNGSGQGSHLHALYEQTRKPHTLDRRRCGI